ncbi:MAG TPA: glycosyltransferase family 4 protein [Bacteroidales bacterium]
MNIETFIKLPILYLDFIIQKRKFKPNLLFFANHHELILLFPVLIFNRVPVVCHMHDPSPAIKFQKISFWFYSKIVTKFVAISKSVENRTIALGCKPDKISVIQNGIKIPDNLDRSSRNNHFCDLFNWPHDVFIVGITGQISETKGHLDVLEAIRNCYKINNKVRLIIGGHQKGQFFSKLNELIDQFNLRNIVAFSGWQDDISKFFANIDLFVLASRHEEGYGLVVAEAMAYGIPVIGTKSGGIMEIIEDGISGYLVNKLSPSQIAEKILLLSTERNVYKKLTSQGRKRVINVFDIDKQTIKMETFLIRMSEK